MGLIANTKYLHNSPHSQQNGFVVISPIKRVIYGGGAWKCAAYLGSKTSTKVYHQYP